MASSSSSDVPSTALVLKGPRALLHVDKTHMHMLFVDRSKQEMEGVHRAKGTPYFVDPKHPGAQDFARYFTECNGKRVPVSGLFVQLQSDGGDTVFAVEDFIRKRPNGYIGGVELLHEEGVFQHEELSMHMLADLRTVWQARERLGGGLSFRSMFHDVPMWFSITSEGDFRVQEEYTTGACDLYLDQSPGGGWTLHTENGIKLPAKIRVLFPATEEEESGEPKVVETTE